MRLEKHNYKSEKEVYRAMLDGTVFHSKKLQIYFNNIDKVFKVGTLSTEPAQSLEAEILNWEQWQVEIDWKSSISKEKPVLCWVWDYEGDNKTVEAIEHYERGDDGNIFTTTLETGYYHATPVTKEDLL